MPGCWKTSAAAALAASLVSRGSANSAFYSVISTAATFDEAEAGCRAQVRGTRALGLVPFCWGFTLHNQDPFVPAHPLFAELERAKSRLI